MVAAANLLREKTVDRALAGTSLSADVSSTEPDDTRPLISLAGTQSLYSVKGFRPAGEFPKFPGRLVRYTQQLWSS